MRPLLEKLIAVLRGWGDGAIDMMLAAFADEYESISQEDIASKTDDELVALIQARLGARPKSE